MAITKYLSSKHIGLNQRSTAEGNCKSTAEGKVKVNGPATLSPGSLGDEGDACQSKNDPGYKAHNKLAPSKGNYNLCEYFPFELCSCPYRAQVI